MYECRKCRATWPDELVDTWGATDQSSGYGPEPKCVNLVPGRGNEAGQQVCGGRLQPAGDPDDRSQLMLLSPLGDQEKRAQVERHNQERRNALRDQAR